MIIQENDFLKTYNEMNELWEDLNSALINGVSVNLMREFQHPDQLRDCLPSRTAGIYLIRYIHPKHGAQYYVGKSVDIKYRTHVHFNRCPERDSNLLHKKIKAHYKCTTPERFSIAVLEESTDVEALNDLEKHWIKTLNTYHLVNKTNGLNLTQGGDGSGKAKVTPEVYNIIIDKLQNTTLSFNDIAHPGEDAIYDLDRNIVRLINRGEHWLSTGDRQYPIRSQEEVGEIGRKSRSTKLIDASAVSHVVYKDSNKSCYYFPTSTQAAEFAVMSGRYTTDLTTARNKIKKNAKPYETLDAFKSTRITWGVLNIVPNPTDPCGGFAGEVIRNEQGKELGIKIS